MVYGKSKRWIVAEAVGRRVVKCPYGSSAGTKALTTGARTQADSVEWCYFSGHKELDLALWQTDRNASGEPPAMLSACSDLATIENTCFSSCDCDEELCDTES